MPIYARYHPHPLTASGSRVLWVEASSSRRGAEAVSAMLIQQQKSFFSAEKLCFQGVLFAVMRAN